MNGSIQSLALVPKTQRVNFPNLLRVAAAIQKQLDDDLFLEWGRHGSITVWDNPDTVPKDCAPIFVCDAIPDPRLGGFHSTKNKEPYANVLFDETGDWSIDASHEAMEIVLDPKGQTIQRAPSPVPTQGEVDYLVEICDPCGRSFYNIDRVRVSDFYLKNYFDPRPTPGVSYSKNNRLRSPLQVLPGGYLTWRDQTGQWWRQDHFGDMPATYQIYPPDIGGSFREQIDMTTADKRLAFAQKPRKQRASITVKEAQSRRAAANRIRKHSAWLERQLKSLDANQTHQTT